MWPGPHGNVWPSAQLTTQAWPFQNSTGPDDLAKLARQWAIQRGAEQTMIMAPTFPHYPAPWPVPSHVPPPPPPPPPPYSAPEPTPVEPPEPSAPIAHSRPTGETDRLSNECSSTPDTSSHMGDSWT
ncbi:unnamed protein product, partial [Protopolystoma xenopodis]